MSKTRRKGRKAFTLVEILVSMVILGLVMGAVLGLFFAIVTHLEQSNDITTAQQRGEMVLTALGPKILAAGLGMPETSGDKFKNQFSALAYPLTWNSAVMVNGDDELTIVYAVPTEAIVSGEISLTEDTPASVDVIDDNKLPSVSELKKKQGSSLFGVGESFLC